MDVYVARQAVYDREQKVVAYELLFRAAPGTVMTALGAEASIEVMNRAFFEIGWRSLTSGKPALWNVPEDLLLSDVVFLLPCEDVYIEILETARPTEEVLARCRELRSRGYRLVLDDYVGEEEKEPILELCDWVKVDWPGTDHLKRKSIAERPRLLKLAEKVETQADFQHAIGYGYDFIQGYFLSKPEIRTGRKIPAAQVQRLRLMSELAKPEPDLAVVEDAIARDLDLTYRIMTWVNSAGSGRRTEIATVKGALVWLGIENTRRFVSMFAMQSLGGSTHPELLDIALARARFADLLARAAGAKEIAPVVFLGGLFSMLEAILKRPFPEIAAEMKLPSEITSLVNSTNGAGENKASAFLQTAISWQEGHPEPFGPAAELPGEEASRLYVEAVKWVSTESGS